MIGPFRGGRALAVTGVPGNLEKFYFGGVGGGVWESENAGRTWKPIFDSVHTASIGAIAVAPSDPNVIYVGTGEADMRNDVQQGDGMYKSTDAGKTWRHIGLTDTRQIGKVVIDPKDPNTVYVAALGHQYGPNAERGVFKTTDGGQTWSKVLYKNPNVGAIDLAMDPSDSNVIFASMWATRRPPWSIYPPSNGPGGGLFKSTDGGQTWTQVEGHGFPSFVGHVGLSISPADHNRVYALVDTNDFKDGGAYRSDDGGATWTKTSGDRRIWTRGWYFAGITADPKTSETVYVMNTSTYRSTDGGKTFTAIKGAPGGDDYHTMWISPDDPTHMILGCDQGVIVSVDGAKSWSSWYNQPTGQFYHVITDNRFPYWVYGAQQDSGAAGVPSRTIHSGIGALDWRPLNAGGESGTIAPDPLHPGLLIDNGGSKEQVETAWDQSVDPTLSRTDTIWRSEWTQPIAGSPADPHVFYTSHQKIFRTDDGGATWSVISPDLTRTTTTVPPNLDRATAEDNDGQPRRGVVYWLAPSPLKKRMLWAGTDDGLIWLTRDDGKSWKNVTPSWFTPWTKVGIIDAGHYDSETAYAAIDRHRVDDNHPYIYRTHDGGRHWKLVVRGIPGGQFVNVVREDPRRPGLLFAGTDWGVFVSFNDGERWQPMQLNLPAASVRDITFHGDDIVIATHGRAIWILDDASPLRQMAASASPRLFKPQPAMLFQRAGTFGFGAFDEGTPFPPEEPQAQNPAWGASLNYVAPGTGPVVLTVTDANGKLVRRLSSADAPRMIDVNQLDIPAYWVHPEPTMSAARGAHRFVWDLKYRAGDGPTVPPGSYTVKMTASGRSYSQPLKVVPDPRAHASQADYVAQFKMALEVMDEIKAVEAEQRKATTLLRTKGGSMAAPRLQRLQELTGGSGRRRRRLVATPDEGGLQSTDVTSFGAVLGGMRGVLGAIESAPAAPTPEYRRAFEALKKKAARDVRLLKSLERS